MPLREPTGMGTRKPPTPIVFHPKTKKTRKAKAKTAKGRTSARSAKTARTPAAKLFHELPSAGTLAGSSADPTTMGAGSLPFGSSGSGSAATASASPRALLELSGLSSASLEGLGGALLDLVGEGRISVAHALAAWTHEQDRLANRAWRRPGGLQRMGGL